MKERLVRFDWAMKKLLRNKANFEILEGFLSELLLRDVKIQNILESESNKQIKDDKSNRFELLARIDSVELVKIKIILEYMSDYFYRQTFREAKSAADKAMSEQDKCLIDQLISVNIFYFDAVRGEDYIYNGINNLKGKYVHDLLELSDKQDKMIKVGCQPNNIIPEYYILKVNNFDDSVKNTLDEWIFYLKNTAINSEFRAQGLQKAAHVLKLTNLTQDERAMFDRYIDNWRVGESSIKTAWLEGKIQGEMQGKRERTMKRHIEVAIE